MNEHQQVAPPPDCAEVMQQLWDYLDGELEHARWEQIHAHLGTCTGCASHVEFCRSFRNEVRSAGVDVQELASVRARVLGMLKK